MITIENTDVHGFEAAIRGARNPFNSWDKSDSHWDDERRNFIVGDADLKLLKGLAERGDSHGKALRMIHVSCDITAPLYWWKELDTYKVATTRNSCSTMHKIAAKEFEFDDFSYEHLEVSCLNHLSDIMDVLNAWRYVYLKGDAKHAPKDKDSWWQMIQTLPSSYNQRATWDASYQTLRHIYHDREGHKLDEWHKFRWWIEGLPYSEVITG